MSLTVTRILELQNYCSMLHNVPTEVPHCYSGIFSYFMCLFHLYHIVNGESRSMWGVSGLYNIKIEGSVVAAQGGNNGRLHEFRVQLVNIPN